MSFSGCRLARVSYHVRGEHPGLRCSPSQRCDSHGRFLAMQATLNCDRLFLNSLRLLKSCMSQVHFAFCSSLHAGRSALLAQNLRRCTCFDLVATGLQLQQAKVLLFWAVDGSKRTQDSTGQWTSTQLTSALVPAAMRVCLLRRTW